MEIVDILASGFNFGVIGMFFGEITSESLRPYGEFEVLLLQQLSSVSLSKIA